jgi:hypothetical protein
MKYYYANRVTLSRRVTKSVFTRYHLRQDMKEFGTIVLGIEESLEKTLLI